MSEPEYKLTMRFGHSFTRPECMGTIIEGGGSYLPEPPPSMPAWKMD